MSRSVINGRSFDSGPCSHPLRPVPPYHKSGRLFRRSSFWFLSFSFAPPSARTYVHPRASTRADYISKRCLPPLEGKLTSRPFPNRLLSGKSTAACVILYKISLSFTFILPVYRSASLTVELIYEILADFKKEEEKKGGLVPSRVFFPTSPFEFIGPTEIFNASNIVVVVVVVIVARNPLLVLSHFVARRTLTESRIRWNPRFKV